MWSKRAGALDAPRGAITTTPPWRGVIAALGVALALAPTACGGPKSKPSTTPILGAPRFSRRLEATELMPSDLDLVVRVDLARMRDGLGPVAVEALTRRALQGRGDTIVKGLLPCASVLWLGVRLLDDETADHVAVVEGHDCEVVANTSEWKRTPSANGQLTIYDRLTEPARDGTSKVVIIADRAVVLVSPVEAPSVERVLRDGPDVGRGEPKAEGLVSVDVRGHRLTPELERRFPAIGRLVAGVYRVRALGQLVDQGLEIEAEVTNKSSPEAARAVKVLEALRDNVESDAARALLHDMKIEQVESTVRVRWTVPARAVLAAIDDTPKAAAK